MGEVQNLAGLRRMRGVVNPMAERFIKWEVRPVGKAVRSTKRMADPRIVNLDGSTTSIVHQSDRFANISLWLRKRWRQGSGGKSGSKSGGKSGGTRKRANKGGKRPV